MKMYRPHRLYPRNSKPKEPSLYRSLCVSILCMFLSTVMLVGTTMAWFSDSLQTGVYTITSADFSTTVYYCTDLSNANNTPNNWQRLNPGNTTMFGGGSLSGSSSYQTAYLKIVNASDIGLKYTLSITGETTGEGSSTPPLSLAYKEVDNEAGLNSAFTSADESSTQSGENTSTGTAVSFTVPKATTMDGAATPTIKFVALKLSLNVTPTSSPDNEQIATQYKFGLRLAITQNRPEAQVTESDPPITMGGMTITVGTPSAPVLTAPNAAIVDKNDSNGSIDDVVNGDGSSNNGIIESGGNGNTNNGGNNDNDGKNDVDDSGKTVDDEESQSIDSSSENLS